RQGGEAAPPVARRRRRVSDVPRAAVADGKEHRRVDRLEAEAGRRRARRARRQGARDRGEARARTARPLSARWVGGSEAAAAAARDLEARAVRNADSRRRHQYAVRTARGERAVPSAVRARVEAGRWRRRAEVRRGEAMTAKKKPPAPEPAGDA